MSGFTLFPCLPQELRLKIWSFALLALSPPCQIEIHTTRYPGPDEEWFDSPDITASGSLKLAVKCYHIDHQYISSQQQQPRQQQSLSSDDTPPAISKVNNESRHVFLERYRLGIEVQAIGRKWFHIPRSCEHLESVKMKMKRRKLYIDPDRDVIIFKDYSIAPSSVVDIVEMYLLDRHVVKCPFHVAVSSQHLVSWLNGDIPVPDLRVTKVLIVVRRVVVGDGDDWPVYEDGNVRIGGDVLRGEEDGDGHVGGVVEGLVRRKMRKEFERPQGEAGFRVVVVESWGDVFDVVGGEARG